MEHNLHLVITKADTGITFKLCREEDTSVRRSALTAFKVKVTQLHHSDINALRAELTHTLSEHGYFGDNVFTNGLNASAAMTVTAHALCALVAKDIDEYEEIIKLGGWTSDTNKGTVAAIASLVIYCLAFTLTHTSEGSREALSAYKALKGVFNSAKKTYLITDSRRYGCVIQYGYHYSGENQYVPVQGKEELARVFVNDLFGEFYHEDDGYEQWRIPMSLCTSDVKHLIHEAFKEAEYFE